MTRMPIPDMALVVLVGASGSGKSTFAAAHFGQFETLSSDFFRGLVSNDENDQAATPAAFEALRFVAGKRLDAGLLTVIDATNVQPDARRSLIALAREHDVLPVAIVLDVPQSVCVERNAGRTDRAFGASVVKRQHDQLRRSLKHLGKEGFRRVHVLSGADEIAAAEFVREPLLNDRREESGPFDAIGDVHGCRSELEALLGKLGYELVRDEVGRPVDAVHPEARRVIFLGDLVDRGPDAPGVLRLAMGMVAAGHALAVPGNHEAKLVRALEGKKVQTSHGLAETLAQLSNETEEFRQDVLRFCRDLVAHLVLDEGRLVVAHAGLIEKYHGRASGRVRAFSLFGDTTGETDEYGLPVRLAWAEEYRGKATVLYGHVPTLEAEWVNGTMCLDTGCVFGGKLSALRYPEKEVVDVPAEKVWYEPVVPLGGPGSGGERPGESVTRDPMLLKISDVLGKQVIETRAFGKVGIREDNAARALEVMSRFATDPRRLVYLPPTMSPPHVSTRDGILEHPAEAFAAYRREGIGRVICEEKHMGSRAVVLLTRDPARFGAPSGWLGAVHTRTGRPFFDEATTKEFLSRLDRAVETAGLWRELSTSWLLFDAELLPWSLKADSMIREQYASVAAAATSALPAAVRTLQSAVERGVDVDELLTRTQRRASNAVAYRDAYRRYRQPVSGLYGVQLAPFQLLASEGVSRLGQEHGWHLAIADRLADADAELIRRTRSIEVDLESPESEAAATEWWEELTGAGGEGMVVKPTAGLARGTRALAQPGIKVRGAEYLRIIYGPDYLDPENLARLRDRDVGHKRSMALREYALGVEAVERFVAEEPLWRVHQAVFGVLAMESEPVDPRL
ncbi:polynucleotide 3'-phosphatase /polynucleotide 5'-hydroxyl-kinase /polynucleotide 2',3'-cyclic phosphate phosphodiesterase [Agreia bicolorata]|uniref:Polynucleotide 3'-phosphatase /polynucleotide 5'-hydroxyl-kinase /polynucleotide 2',3'-cyclic phosphate phosphodiesterase n=1 Tax=Agreia bicolorata TaxID=110935 RepID=A0A1T4YHK7_9MICO|nr:polynucleotide kinase-phosphatase [Agreia bicolorata]SKB00771.1 polynucleotide 3'-phosphatase /polynucleotide 5'-hydroxyl-kinase /polynucleotide 2',3'-cyclic phosphate phosphodiesterase [Agreia bicolorata]